MTLVASSPRQRAWRIALPVYLLFVTALIALYFETASAIVTIWYRSETFAHGFLVLPIVLWLVWRKRSTLTQIQPANSAWALLPLAVAAFAWLVGELAVVNALSQMAFIAMLALLVPTLLGIPVARAITFPLIFLFFGAPFGEFVMPQLMAWTADFTVVALRLSGIPVYREGLQFVIPSGNWSVVEACSGVRYLIASLTVGTLFAYLNYQTTWRRVVFIIVSLLVPVVANWLRAYMIVMLGHLSGNKLAVGFDHLIYGWVFFGVVIMIMFWIGARWSEPDPEPAVALTPSAHTALASDAVYSVNVFFVVGVLLLLALPHIGRWAIDRQEAALPVPVLVAPATLASHWVAVPEQSGGWQPEFPNPSAHISTSYAAGGQNVNLYVGYYRHQGIDRKLVSSTNVLVKSNDPIWSKVANGTRQLLVNDAAVKIRTAELRGTPLAASVDAQRLLVWQVYWVNGILTSSDIMAKAYTALFSILGKGDDSAVIVVSTPKGDAGQGESILQAFFGDNADPIQHWLQKVKQ